jgi:hypothetical protein
MLGTEDGIAALEKILEDSGAFTKTGRPLRDDARVPTFEDEPDPFLMALNTVTGCLRDPTHL